jgi:ElaB/YqjD/DUF883 family membrane-anchored ribosome-binding protein
MTRVTESAAEAVREYAEPIRTAVEENIRNVGRGVVAGRHALEDAAAETTVQVRRHPALSLGIAAGIGTLCGCAIGFAVGRFGTMRPSR